MTEPLSSKDKPESKPGKTGLPVPPSPLDTDTRPVESLRHRRVEKPAGKNAGPPARPASPAKTPDTASLRQKAVPAADQASASPAEKKATTSSTPASDSRPGTASASRRAELVSSLKARSAEAQSWRVIFQALTPEGEVVGMDVRRAAVIGRADPKRKTEVDLDLSTQDKGKMGVSRQHALLLPADEGLYLIDLDSTNGTWINGLYLQPGQKYPLRTGDVVEFGLLKMLVRVVGAVPRGDEGSGDTTLVARAKPKRRPGTPV